MRARLFAPVLLGMTLLHGGSWAAKTAEFDFAVIAHPAAASADEDALRAALEETDQEKLAFVIAHGIKAADEPCTDKLYLRRKALLQAARNAVMVSLAASDWVECKNANGKPAAIGKLNRLRELFFADDVSFGANKIAVMRQSLSAKYRDFAENARWEIGDIMFATINIPAQNNHYVLEAGRNSEFEDRLVANRDWLNRIFSSAARKKLAAIVLFCDANPLAENRSAAQRDGYLETRKSLRMLAEKFPGKVLIVSAAHPAPPALPRIQWQANLGELHAGTRATRITVSHADAALLSVTAE